MQLICLTNPKFRLKCSNHVFIRQSDNTMTESQVSTAWLRTQIARSRQTAYKCIMVFCSNEQAGESQAFASRLFRRSCSKQMMLENI
jgi:hypothetical protein